MSVGLLMTISTPSPSKSGFSTLTQKCYASLIITALSISIISCAPVTVKTLWKRDPTSAARSVLNGGWRDRTSKTLPNLTVVTRWRTLISKKSTEDKPSVQHVDTLWCLTNPVTPDEVKMALVGVSGVSGPDGETWASLRGIAKETLSSLFNISMLAGKYPKLSLRALLPSSQKPGTRWAVSVMLYNRYFHSWQIVRLDPGQAIREGP